MNNYAFIVLLTVFSFCQVSPAFSQDDNEDEIQRDFRKLKRIPDQSADLKEVLPLVNHLARLDPEDSAKYLREGLDKIEPATPKLTPQQGVSELRDINSLSGAIFKQVQNELQEIERELNSLKNKDNLSPDDVLKMQLLLDRSQNLILANVSMVRTISSASTNIARILNYQ